MLHSVVTVVDHGPEKARGEKRLGNPQGFAGKVYREGGKACARMAGDFAARLGPLGQRMRSEGLSLRAATTVKGVLDRLG